MQQITSNLPAKTQAMLNDIKKKDDELYQMLLIKLIRMLIVAKTGNLKIWKKIKNNEEKNLQYILNFLTTHSE